MVTPRRILCLSALLAVLLTASAGAAGEGSVPAAFWQEGTLYAFARLTEDPAGAEPRLQLGTADLTLPAEGPLARVSDAGTPVSYLLLVDRSNSMGGLSGNVTAFAKRLIREEAAFSLASFGVDFQLLDTGGGTGDELLAALDGVAYGEEGTDLPTAVVAAMDHLEARDRSPGELVNLVILTDGVTEAVEDGEALEMARYRVAEDPSVLVHTVGLATGRAVSQEALDALASLGAGVHTVVGAGGVSADAAAQAVARDVGGLWTAAFSVAAQGEGSFGKASLCLLPEGADTPSLRLTLPAVPLLTGGEGTAPPETPAPSPGGELPAQTPDPAPTETAPPETAPGESPPAETDAPPESAGGSGGGAAAPAGDAARVDPVWIAGGVGLAVAVLAAVLLLIRRSRRQDLGEDVPPGAIRLHLEVLEGRCDQDGQELYLTGELTIGRDRRCDLVFRERSLPPLAGRICLRDGFLFLEELDPRCETLLEGMRLYGPSRLRSGDVISMGPARFLFRF
ncbi:FHA domain-containing protein [uncultured Intestinimonas sp.]|uniref:VWA domain-containing protein n=1 Tax=uncultured Intestinimonas sp. TaxID=1689265 RepID=UPI0025E2FC10|nr:FHA domain-containing protein [uncultured Intestinimonas sp.]